MTVSQAAYGLRFDGLGPDGALAAQGAENWPPARVLMAGPSDRDGPLGVHGDSALIGMPQGVIALDRTRRTAVIEASEPLGPDELVHPYLWPIAAVLARWMGRETLHAGAFLLGGGAWGVLGDSGDGKSTLLAWIARRGGLEVLTDDLLVTHDLQGHAGPRCVDVEPAAAEALGIEGKLVRATLRRRLALPPVQGRAPLRGWVFLEWADDVAVEPVPLGERLSRLSRFRRGSEMGTDGVDWLGLMALPMAVLRRPRSFDRLDEAGQKLLQHLDS